MAEAQGHWVTTWAASIQGAYPLGSAIAQPDLTHALPNAALGSVAQSMRMVLKPALWSPRIRLRLSNVFGDRELAVRDLAVGLHLGGGALVPGTLTAPVEAPFVVAAGQSRWTDTLCLPWVDTLPVALLQGRCLAVSWHLDGPSGPISWHAKAMGTSYLSTPATPCCSRDDGAQGFSHSTTSWFFIDAVDAWLPADAQAVVALGDSLTDGTATTLNGHDRWTDVLQRELAALGRHDVAVVNAGIGGNQIAGPRDAPAGAPWRGGPSAVSRLQRDVISLSGVRQVLWLQGINDFSDNGGCEADEVLAAVRKGVDALRTAGLRVTGATVPSALHGTRPGHGGALQDARRRAFNQALRAGSVFDALVDIDARLTDPRSGALRAAYNGDSTFGEAGDGVHPNRAAHTQMALAFLQALSP